MPFYWGVMKTTFKVIGAIFSLGLVIAVGLHVVLLHGLTKAMRDVILPRVKQEMGIDARVGRLSINMANGCLFLEDVEVRNPEGFLLDNMASVDRIEVEVDLFSLFKQKLIRVNNVEVENALVNVIRNKDGDLNLSMLQEGIPEQPVDQLPIPESGTPQSGKVPKKGRPISTDKDNRLPEILIESIFCNAKVRYVDFKLNQLDIALDLKLNGKGISTQLNPETPWGTANIVGSLGDNRTSFVTDINLRLAPITNPEELSFDLNGTVLEIDPSIMVSAYSKLGIRSAPFGFEPKLYCRKGLFEHSHLALTLKDIELENKLANRLGGMARIGSLHFVVPVVGSLMEPGIDIQSALMGAIGSNTGNLLDAFLKGAAGKEVGMDQLPETVADAVVEVLGKHVDEIGESEVAKKILKDLSGGESSGTNTPDSISSDTLIDLLGEQVDEIGENEELKDELKNLGKWLFGK